MENQKRFCAILAMVFGAFVGPVRVAGQDFEPASVATFELPATDGQKISISKNDPAKFTVVCFLGTECPLAKLYAGRLQELHTEFKNDGVRFIGVSCNQQDSMDEWKEFIEERGIQFECGKDYDNIVADNFRIERTPEVVVIDAQRNIQYRGRIDDQYSPGIARNHPERNDLKIAITELLAGQPVTEPQTAPEGCLIGRIKKPQANSDVTYANQVSRILQNRCVECHREGEIAPFALEEYAEVVGWAEMMVETIDNGRMPPWHADPRHGSFTNERLMPTEEKELIRRWVNNGAPMGGITQLPPQKEFVEGWRLPRQPDLVIPMHNRPFVIPADGTIEYKYFVVDPKFTEEKWVSAAEVIPGARDVVHHSIVFVRPPDGTRMRGVGWLGAYVPGQTNLDFKPDRAMRIPAGSKLVFQQHYTPNGMEASDITKVGIVFADRKDVKEEFVTLMALDQQFEIPPHEPNHVVNAALEWIPKNGQLLSVSPHMHFRGKSFLAEIRRGNKTESETLLSVPKYDFNWQHTYEFRQPIPLADVKEIRIEVAFDNSDDNPFNPDSTQLVTWGDQTWEEMAIGFFNVSLPLAEKSVSAGTETTNGIAKDKDTPATPVLDPQLQQKIDTFVETFFQRFDANRDDLITVDEVPLATRNRAFHRYEHDGEVGLTRAEIARQAELRFNH